MKKMPTSQEKIQQLCDVLERDALKPAQIKAKQIVDRADLEAAQIIEQAKQRAKQIEAEANDQAQKSQATLEGALNSASRQALTALRREIEEKLLDQNVRKLLSSSLSQQEVIQSALVSLFKALEQEGFSGKGLHLLTEETLDQQKLLESVVSSSTEEIIKGITLGVMKEKGLILQLKNENISLECSEEALQALFCQFLRPAFREKFFPPRNAG